MKKPTSPSTSPGFLLWHTTLEWQRRIQAALKPCHLTHGQFVLLAVLWWRDKHHAPAPTQKEVAEAAGTDPMMTSQVLRALEQKALIERRPDGRDTRALRIHVTASGRRVAAAAIDVVEAADGAFFDRVDVDALLPFLQVLAYHDGDKTP